MITAHSLQLAPRVLRIRTSILAEFRLVGESIHLALLIDQATSKFSPDLLANQDRLLLESMIAIYQTIISK